MELLRYICGQSSDRGPSRKDKPPGGVTATALGFDGRGIKQHPEGWHRAGHLLRSGGGRQELGLRGDTAPARS